MNTVLGGLFSSRINLNLREDKGYSYGAFSFIGQNRGVGPFMAGAQVRGDVTGPSAEELLKEVTKMRDGGVTDEELALAKESITRPLPANFETTASTAGTMAGLYLFDLPLDYYETLPARVNAITAADVAAVAKKYLTPERMVVVAVGDRKSIEPQLQKLEPRRHRDPRRRRERGRPPPATRPPRAAVAARNANRRAAPHAPGRPSSFPRASGARKAAALLRRGPRRRRHLRSAAASHVVLDEEEPALAGPANDAQELLHARDLLELLVHEPLEEIPRDVIRFGDREVHETVDLLRDGHLPGHGELHRLLGRLERRPSAPRSAG